MDERLLRPKSGHYAASLALKSVEKKASLGMLFLAVQFVDILFSQFVLRGIERMNIIENYTASTHFELVFMPYTHSLLAAFLWAGAVCDRLEISLAHNYNIYCKSYLVIQGCGAISPIFVY